MLKTAPRVNRIQPSATTQAAKRARALKAEGRPILNLTIGEPDFDTPAHVLDAAEAAMRGGATHYPPVDGTPALKQAIQAKFARENGLDYALDEIMVSAGGKQVIFNAMMATVSAGDEVILAAPYWTSYPDIVRLAHGEPVVVDSEAERGFKLTPKALEAAITERTRWLLLNSPSNPAGATYSRNEMVALTEVLLRHPQVWLLADDIYEHILFDGRVHVTPAAVEPRLKDRTLTMNGVSKAYAMTGWRIGYAGGPKPLIAAMTKLQTQCTSGACSISQAAAVAALDGPQEVVGAYRERFEQRRDRLFATLAKAPGLTFVVPEGAFYAYVGLQDFIGKPRPAGGVIENDSQIVDLLLEDHDVAVVLGSAFGLSPYFRLSFAAAEAVLEEAAERIVQACEDLME